MNAMEISRTGLDVEWRRLEVIAENLANANTVLEANGEPYRAKRMISGPPVSFEMAIANGDGQAKNLKGVAVYSIEAQNLAPRRVYEPAHPQASLDGYIDYPGFDHAAEMALMIKTSRSYEANIIALNAGRQMYAKALDIGRRNG